MNFPSTSAIALAAEDRAITYTELHQRASALAAKLRALGAGPESLVGICMPRSVALGVAVVGVSKSGAAYLPFDPQLPTERMAAMLTSSGTEIVVAAEAAAALIPKGAWQVLTLDCVGNGGFSETASAATDRLADDRLAYVIYTSGSTGTPKGVEVTYANLEHLIRWHHRAFSITDTDRATVFASPGFDASVWEMWPYLAKGATVHMVPDSVRTSPTGLRDWMVKERITVSFLPTAMAERMLDLKWPAQTSLRFLLTGADTLRRRPPAGLPFQLVNNYGPTECTVVATSGIVLPGEDSLQLPSIGSAIDGAIVEIRDSEVLVGGTGVARGYRDQPELTAERFITDPVHGRMYRTGDLAEWLPNGEIAFLGRADDQIKIRGFRIEPNEILQALARNPLVRESAVALRSTGDGGDKRLTAYVVANSATPPSERSLIEGLRKLLPDYMMPSAFVLMDGLPYTENGKLDRSALPEPTFANTIRDEALAEPATPIEERVAALACELLRVERVGVHDNFFLLGGHSLLGAQLVDRVNRDFGVALTLRAVFDYPTVEGLAGEIEAALLERVESMSEEEAQRLLA